jgi:hypothetical protein
MKVYLSHPYGKKAENREKAARLAAWYRKTWERDGMDHEIVNPLDVLKHEEERNTEDEMLALAAELLRKCDAVIFADGWKKSRGCRYEHMVARSEGKEIGYIPAEFCQIFEGAA